MTTPANIFAFFDSPTQQNLESNQRGQLSAGQQAALKRGIRQQWGRVALWIPVLLILCGGFGLLFWALLTSDSLGPSMIGLVLASGGVLAFVFLVVAAFIFPNLSLVFAGREIEEGRIESASGNVEWTGSKYKIVSDSHPLKTVRGTISMPPPGTYRFYFLPSSGLVVLAEALEDISAVQSTNLMLEALSSANRFNPEDIDVNRQGSLSGGQALRLTGFALIQGIVFLLCAGIGVWFYFNQPTGNDRVWFTVFMILLGFFALGAVWNILRTGLDLITQSVANVEGVVIRTEHRTRNGRYYTYQIKNLKFRVPRNAFRALVDGWEYRVYYSSRSKRLLAIEPIRQNKFSASDDMTR
jgi:hypothetical protein